MAPQDNREGVARAFEQVPKAFMSEAPWSVEYDRKADVVYLRRDGHGPAVSYFVPDFEEIVFRLDVASGELTGIDILDFRRVVIKRVPELRAVYDRLMSRRMSWIPWLPKEPAAAAERVMTDVVAGTAMRLRPTFC